MKRTELKRSRMKRRAVRRKWTDALIKTEREGKCRNCARERATLVRMGRTLETVHLIGRTFDRVRDGVRYVDPDSTMPLCGPPTTTGTCHNLFDSHTLNLWGHLKSRERTWVIDRVGEGQARRKIEGRSRI